MIDISNEERTALERFRETTLDEGTYDLPKCMMKRLAEIGLLQHLSRGIYRTTEFGLLVLEGGYNRVQAAIERDIPVQPKLITATREDFDDTFECPSCAKRFSSFDEFDFCPWCGQRLDWSEE